MSKITARISKNWPVRRILGLGIGLFVALQAVLYKDALLGVLSAFFLFQIITNTGCFGVDACSINYPKKLEKN